MSGRAGFGLHAIGQLGQRSIETGPPANRVDGLKAAGRNEPRPGIGRHAVACPLLHGGGERVVQGLFGQFKIAQQSNERREHAPRLVAVHVVDGLAQFQRVHRTNCRSQEVSLRPQFYRLGESSVAVDCALASTARRAVADTHDRQGAHGEHEQRARLGHGLQLGPHLRR